MTALAFVKAVWDFVFDTAARFFKWLRKPGSLLKLLCAVLAFACATAALSSYSRGQRIVVVERERDAAVGGREADRTAFRKREGELQGALAAYQQQERDFAAAVDAEAQRLADARAQSAAAMEEVERRQAAAEASAAAFRREAANKPDACAAALNALEAACPTLRDY